MELFIYVMMIVAGIGLFKIAHDMKKEQREIEREHEERIRKWRERSAQTLDEAGSR